MNIHPYLVYNGNCEEAFKFYEAKLGGKIENTFRIGESPMAANTPKELHNNIMHVSMKLGSAIIMGSDACGQPWDGMKGFSLSISIDGGDVAEAERIFAILADGGNVKMPIAQTFWALRFGMVVDKFGAPWMINCEDPNAHHP